MDNCFPTHYHEPLCSGNKECPRCKEVKPVLAFGVNSRNPDGLNTYCRDCKNTMARETPSSKAKKQRQAESKTRKIKQIRVKASGDLYE